jgi:hypothetical protein
VARHCTPEQKLGKREIEREHLGLFLEAYRLGTGKRFPQVYDSEKPDFIVRDDKGRIVGIEIAQLRFTQTKGTDRPV